MQSTSLKVRRKSEGIHSFAFSFFLIRKAVQVLLMLDTLEQFCYNDIGLKFEQTMK